MYIYIYTYIHMYTGAAQSRGIRLHLEDHEHALQHVINTQNRLGTNFQKSFPKSPKRPLPFATHCIALCGTTTTFGILEFPTSLCFKFPTFVLHLFVQSTIIPRTWDYTRTHIYMNTRSIVESLCVVLLVVPLRDRSVTTFP